MPFSHDNSSPLLPMWFRGVLIGIATVIMCSCAAPAPGQAPAGPFRPAPGEYVQAPCPPQAEGAASGECTGCAACGLPGPCDEYLCDGGDYYSPVGVREDWTIEGLEQEDTVVHYDTLDGRVVVKPSNRVCIYAPRFGAVRRVVNLVEGKQPEFVGQMEDDMSLAMAADDRKSSTTLQNLMPETDICDLPPSLLRERQQPGGMECRVAVRELTGMIKPYCNLSIMRLGVMDNAEKPWLAKTALAALTWAGDQAVQVTIEGQAASAVYCGEQPGVVYNLPDTSPCLRLVKCASTDNALPGEEVEFTLRFDNVGTEPVGNVTIVDNLATRLAFVPESASASIDADFSTSENGAGSLVLRWEITEPVPPGEGGLLQFRVKVR